MARQLITKPLITLTSDFGVQTQGVGLMQGIALQINPEANVINLMHGLPSFDITVGARTLETVKCLNPGYHVCVVDPGVGTKREPIIIKAKRGDYLIGPDNGVLIPAARILGGIEKVVAITNPKFMNHPVSPIFHGRDVFTPAAAHLSNGISMEEFGLEINQQNLTKAPYEEAVLKNNEIISQVISINKFGSVHLNILQPLWDELGVKDKVLAEFKIYKLILPFRLTFGDVPKGKPMIFKDDYSRIEMAVNQGSFVKKYHLNVGDKIKISKQ